MVTAYWSGKRFCYRDSDLRLDLHLVGADECIVA
jgi:hypothetical protein